MHIAEDFTMDIAIFSSILINSETYQTIISDKHINVTPIMGGLARLTTEYIQIIITSAQKVDNMIVTQVWYKPLCGPYGVR